ncbi:MAG: hypothetical protein ABF289_11070, partial [Clostridiales bacterium]
IKLKGNLWQCGVGRYEKEWILMIYKTELEKLKNDSGKKFTMIIDKVVQTNLSKLNEDDKKKHIDLSVVDGMPSGESTKVYNIMKIKQNKLIELLLQGVLLHTVGETVSFILSMLLFISTVSQNTKIQLRERESKVLYCIYNLETNLSYDRIKNKYQELFDVPLKDIEINRSISFLEKLKTVKHISTEKVKVIEEINVKYE